MNDTVYKLQKRVESYSTEAEVYQEGTNRINVEIPGVYDAEKILEELGNPGTVQFYEVTDASAADMSDEEKAEAKKAAEAAGLSDSSTFNLVMDGNDLIDAQPMTQKDSYGNAQYVVELTMNSEGAEKFKEATAPEYRKTDLYCL